MDVLNYGSLQKQSIPTFSDRAETSRGVLTPMLGAGVSLATQLVKRMIANDRKKYIADYNTGLTDLYFYDQLSLDGPFDPVGMQFNGFTVVRTFTNKDGRTDTALIARFSLDTRQPYEIINNSIFRLRVEEVVLNYTRVKLTDAQQKTVNMDFDIRFITSYVNEQGNIFKEVELGRFLLLLRGMPVEKSAPGYQAYYQQLKGMPLDGKSFVVPRSFGYYIAAGGQAAPAYSQGAYSISVNIRESAKDKFVTRVMVNNSDKLLDLLERQAKTIISK